MAIYRLQCSLGADTAFPRDRWVITPHFSTTTGISDGAADQLCEDLADALQLWDSHAAREITVKAYDAQGTVPVYPVGSAIRDVGMFPASTAPREVALCLSFYSGQNIPRRRGRLYIPYNCIVDSGSPPLRPSQGQINQVAALVPIFTGLGGVDVDWCVFSRKDDAAYSVSNWWVDNEWDTMRSRGMRSTSRTTGSVSE